MYRDEPFADNLLLYASASNIGIIQQNGWLALRSQDRNIPRKIVEEIPRVWPTKTIQEGVCLNIYRSLLIPGADCVLLSKKTPITDEPSILHNPLKGQNI